MYDCVSVIDKVCELHCHRYSLGSSQGALQVAKESRRELTSFSTIVYDKGLSTGKATTS